MCQDCGCSITEHTHEHAHEHSHEHKNEMGNIHANPQLNDKKTIDVITKILDKNDHEAGHNRSHFDNHGVLAINLMSSPVENASSSSSFSSVAFLLQVLRNPFVCIS